ncbi:MAG: tetratricopeptide repeat protein, partial [Lentisphaerae bacterium]|nr:tetratricopeptide repeat protein [Lentisphaerota bacterium]
MRKYPRIHAVLVLAFALPVSAAMAAGQDAEEFSFAEGLFVHKDYRSAVEEFAAFVKKFPKSELVAAASYRIGECHMRLADHKAAATAFDRALKTYPAAKGSALGAYNLGRARRHLKLTEAALAAFTTATAKGTGQVREEALVGTGECLVDLKRLDEAAKSYTTLLESFPKSKHRPAALFSLGWLNSKLNRHDQAVKAFTTLLREFPKHESAPKAGLALSDAYAALGQFDKSAEALKTVSGAAEMAQDVMLRKAWNEFKSGSKAKAAKSFAAFADAFPKNVQAPSARFNAGIACFDTADYGTALKHFSLLLKDFPKATEAGLGRYWAGLCLFNLSKYAETCAMLKPLVGKEKSMDAAKRDVFDCVYAQALAKTGKHPEAIAQLRAFLKRAPKSKQARTAAYALAQSLQHMGDLKGAVSALQALLADLPDGPLRHNALFAAGEYLFRLKQPKAALPHLEELVKAEPRNPKALYRLAWTYFELERFKDAQGRFAALPELSNTFRNEALFLSGRAAEKLGKKDQAITAYKRLIAAAPVAAFTEKAMARLAFLYAPKEAEQNLVLYEKQFPKGEHLAEIRLKVAETRFSAGDTDGAATLYGLLLKQPTTPLLTTSAVYGAAWC